ncbi:hypothetical protein HOD75_01295 [archaeon]|jgi:hypothetical protein|nr:hypothetical protein [archaeon]
MMDTCPNCGINLKQPPFNNRNTNEVMIVLNYRKFMDNDQPIGSFEDLGVCEVCDATKQDVVEQKNHSD